MRVPVNQRDGLSLIEVLLALSILAVSLMMLGQLLRVGSRNASLARELTKAQLYCQSVMSGIEAGVIPPTAVSSASLEQDPDWSYTVEIGSLEWAELLSVQVTVTEMSESSRPVSASLTRWLIDPEYLLRIEAEQQAAEDAAAADAAAGESDA